MVAAVAAVVWLLMDIQKKAEKRDWEGLLKQVEVVAVSIICCVACCVDVLGGGTVAGKVLTGLVIAAVSTGYHKVASTAIAVRDANMGDAPNER